MKFSRTPRLHTLLDFRQFCISHQRSVAVCSRVNKPDNAAILHHLGTSDQLAMQKLNSVPPQSLHLRCRCRHVKLGTAPSNQTRRSILTRSERLNIPSYPTTGQISTLRNNFAKTHGMLPVRTRFGRLDDGVASAMIGLSWLSCTADSDSSSCMPGATSCPCSSWLFGLRLLG